MSNLLLTFDTDWVPPFFIEDVLSLVNDIPATFFVTDEAACKVLAGIPNVELGVHPNFMPGSSHGSKPREVLETVMKLVPGAQAVRSHRLFQFSAVLDLYVEYGINYDLTLIEYQNPSPRCFRYWNGLIRLPFNFEDDVALLRGESVEVPMPSWMRSASTLVCDFHPMHIYLNTEVMDRYVALRNRGSLQELSASDIEPFVNRKGPGTRNILSSLLEKVCSGEMTPFSISGLVQKLGAEPWATPNLGRLSSQCPLFRPDL